MNAQFRPAFVDGKAQLRSNFAIYMIFAIGRIVFRKAVVLAFFKRAVVVSTFIRKIQVNVFSRKRGGVIFAIERRIATFFDIVEKLL
jgi:hypothetical protein